MKHLLLVLLCAGLISVHAAEPKPPEPGDEYFKYADIYSPAISPEGKSVAFIARTGGHTRLFRLDLATGQLAGIFDPGEGDIWDYRWITESLVLLNGRGKGSDVSFTYNLATKKIFQVGLLDRVGFSDIRLYSGLPGRAVIASEEYSNIPINGTFGRNYLAAVDLVTGREKRIGGYHGRADNTVLSSTGELRAESWMEGATWHVRWRKSVDASWQEIKGSDSWPSFVPVAMTPDDQKFFVLANDQGDSSVLMLLDPATGERTLLAQRAGKDIVEFVFSGGIQSLVGVRFNDPIKDDTVYLDPAWTELHRKAQRSLPGSNTRLWQRTADGRTAIIFNWDSGHPLAFYLYANDRLSLLGQQRDALTPAKLGQVRAFSYTARDGRARDGFVTLPAKAGRPLPLLVITPQFVGEMAATGLAYEAATQYYVSRGYAVAQFITSGQYGYGRAFEASGDFALSGKVLEDVTDGIAHLAQEGTIDPARVGLYGYGDKALLALYAGRDKAPFRAVVIHDPGKRPNNSQIRWQSSRRLRTADIVKEAGGTDEVSRLMRKIDPVETVPALAVPVLMVGYKTVGSSTINDLASKHHKPLTWLNLDRTDPGDQASELDLRVAKAIADFLDAQLKAPAP